MIHTSRRACAAVMTALLTLSATACTANSKSDQGATRAIQHRFGVTQVPQSAQRIVTIGAIDADTLVALGVTPVGAVDSGQFTKTPFYPWVNDALVDGKTKPLSVDDVFAAKIEEVAALKPDLIFMVNVYADPEEQYKRLSALAPTVAARSADVAQESWQAQTLHIGRALGKESQAQAKVAAVETLITKTSTENPKFSGKTLSYGGAFSTTEVQVVFGEKDYSRVFLKKLGFTVPAKQREELPALVSDDVGTQAPVSLERLDLLDADVLLLGYTEPKIAAEFPKLPVFKQLPVVSQGRYIGVDGPTIAALRMPSPLSVPYVLNKLVPSLQKAIP